MRKLIFLLTFSVFLFASDIEKALNEFKTQNFKSSFEIFSEICKNGDVIACEYVGNMLYSGIGVAKNVEKAVDIHIKNCENGNFESCSQAGFMLQKNSGDNVQIKDLYSKSCINNSGAGCNNLGFFYFSIEKNSEKATELYERSCNLGFGMGCLNSGLSYFHNGNEDLALTRFEKACDMGVDDACFVLSTLQISDY